MPRTRDKQLYVFFFNEEFKQGEISDKNTKILLFPILLSSWKITIVKKIYFLPECHSVWLPSQHLGWSLWIPGQLISITKQNICRDSLHYTLHMHSWKCGVKCAHLQMPRCLLAYQSGCWSPGSPNTAVLLESPVSSQQFTPHPCPCSKPGSGG